MFDFYKFLKNFLSFFSKYNVNVINVGIAFLVSSQMSALVNSFVQNILIPIIDFFIGKQLSQEHIQIGKLKIKIGAFINSLITFFLTLYVVYFVISFSDKLPAILNNATAKAITTASVVSQKARDTSQYVAKNVNEYVPKNTSEFMRDYSPKSEFLTKSLSRTKI